MFVRMHVLPELPQLYQGWISTAGRFLGVIWTVFVYLSHLSWVTRNSDPEISGNVWVKEHFSHGSTSLSDFLTEFCQVHQGFTETRGGTSSHIMDFASRDFFQVKRWYHSKGTTNSSLGKFVAGPNSLIDYSLTKNSLQTTDGLDCLPQFLPLLLSRQIEDFWHLCWSFYATVLTRICKFLNLTSCPSGSFSWFCGLTPTKYHADTHSPTNRVQERIEGIKAGKFVSWHKDSFIEKAKVVHVNKTKQGINSLLHMGRQVFSHLQEGRASLCEMFTCEHKCHHSKCPLLSFFFRSALPTEHDVKLSGTPFGQLGSPALAASPPNLPSTFSHLINIAVWKEKENLI